MQGRCLVDVTPKMSGRPFASTNRPAANSSMTAHLLTALLGPHPLTGPQMAGRRRRDEDEPHHDFHARDQENESETSLRASKTARQYTKKSKA